MSAFERSWPYRPKAPREDHIWAGIQGVYVICPSLDGPCKVGVTWDLPLRLGGLQTGNWQKLHPAAFDLYCQGVTKGGGYVGLPQAGRMIEAATHLALRDLGRSLTGEWFNVTAVEAVTAVAKVASGLNMIKLQFSDAAKPVEGQRPPAKLLATLRKNHECLLAGTASLRAQIQNN